ncbi:MAG: hypothetical protein AAFU61_10285, partial [Pseudomonadota bacterium]
MSEARPAIRLEMGALEAELRLDAAGAAPVRAAAGPARRLEMRDGVLRLGRDDVLPPGRDGAEGGAGGAAPTLQDAEALTGRRPPEIVSGRAGTGDDGPAFGAFEAFGAFGAFGAFETWAAAAGRPAEALAEEALRLAGDRLAEAVGALCAQAGLQTSQVRLDAAGPVAPRYLCRAAARAGVARARVAPQDLQTVRVRLRHAVEAPLTARSRLQAAADLDRLSVMAMAEAAAQGVPERDMALAATLLLRDGAAQEALPAPFGTLAQMRAAFAEARRGGGGGGGESGGGGAPEEAALTIEAACAEASGRATVAAEAGAEAGTLRIFADGAWRAARLRPCARLRPGEPLDGPAILTGPRL